MTYYKIPQRTTLYTEPSQDGLYKILPACNNVHVFTIPENGFLRFNLVNAEPNTQDMSMRGWISDDIMGDMLFYDIRYDLCPFSIPRAYSFDNINIPTLGLEFKIYDSLYKEYKNEELKLTSNKEFFLCVQNIQNKNNTYRLVLSTDEIIKNYDNQLDNGSGFSCNIHKTKDVYDSNGNFRYVENDCKCICHKRNTRKKSICPQCGCAPNVFSRDNLT